MTKPSQVTFHGHHFRAIMGFIMNGLAPRLGCSQTGLFFSFVSLLHASLAFVCFLQQAPPRWLVGTNVPLLPTQTTTPPWCLGSSWDTSSPYVSAGRLRSKNLSLPAKTQALLLRCMLGCHRIQCMYALCVHHFICTWLYSSFLASGVQLWCSVVVLGYLWVSSVLPPGPAQDANGITQWHFQGYWK